MSNLKYGFDSQDLNTKPDMLMFSSAVLRSSALHKFVSLFDADSLSVGHLHSFALSEGKSLKLAFWDTVSEIEKDFEYESSQARYANLIGLLVLRVIEFNIDANTLINDMVLIKPNPYCVSKKDYECDSIVTKIKSLRRML